MFKIELTEEYPSNDEEDDTGPEDMEEESDDEAHVEDDRGSSEAESAHEDPADGGAAYHSEHDGTDCGNELLLDAWCCFDVLGTYAYRTRTPRCRSLRLTRYPSSLGALQSR